MREEYEKIKEEVHQSLTHTNGVFLDQDKISDSKLLLNLSLPSGGGGGLDPHRKSSGALMSPDPMIMNTSHRRDVASTVVLPNTFSGKSIKQRA